MYTNLTLTFRGVERVQYKGKYRQQNSKITKYWRKIRILGRWTLYSHYLEQICLRSSSSTTSSRWHIIFYYRSIYIQQMFNGRRSLKLSTMWDTISRSRQVSLCTLHTVITLVHHKWTVKTGKARVSSLCSMQLQVVD